jgi:flagellar motor switch protein FliM
MMGAPSDNVNSPGRPGQSAEDRLQAVADAIGKQVRSAGAADAAVELSGGTRLSYGEYLAGIDDHACCWLLDSPGGAVWMEIDRDLAAVLADGTMGGAGSPGAAPGPLSHTARLALRPLIGRAADALSGALGAEISLADRSAASPRQAGQASPPNDAPCFVIDLDVRVGAAGGRWRTCLPAALASSFTERQATTDSGLPARQDDQPAEGMREPPAQAPWEVSAVAPVAGLSDEQLAGLAAGDVVVSSAGADGEVIVAVNGHDRFAGRIGCRNGRRAVMIVGPLKDPEEAGAEQ